MVVALRLLDSRRIAPGDDFTEQAEAPRLVTALLVELREGHGLPRTFQSIVKAPFEQVRLGEPRELHRPPHAHRAHRRCVLYHLLEKVPPLVRTRGECARVSKTSEHCPGLEVPRPNENPRALQRIDGPVEITLGKRHATAARQGLGKSEWVVSAFRDPECLLGMRPRITESPQA